MKGVLLMYSGETNDLLEISICSTLEGSISELTNLLIQVVEDGASIGFLPPLSQINAQRYWETVIQTDIILFVARMNKHIVGSVQIHLCSKENGLHRAEIAKLMVHPAYRRKGIARLLMEKAHSVAIEQGRTLLVLDTRNGDPSNVLYTSLGYTLVGCIPNYAKSQNGQLDGTNIYYKEL